MANANSAPAASFTLEESEAAPVTSDEVAPRLAVDTVLDSQAPNVHQEDLQQQQSKSSSLLSAASNLFTAAKEKAESLHTSGVQALQAASQRMAKRVSEVDSGAAAAGSVPAADEGAAAAVEPSPVPGDATALLTANISAAQQQAAVLASSLYSKAAEMGKKTKESSNAAYQAAVEGIRRLTTPSRRVATICKAELRSKPCPQTLLLCCNVMVTKGLATFGVFKAEPESAAAVTHLFAQLEGGYMLVPSDVDALTAAATIKHFLASLDDPILMHKNVDRWIAAGKTLGSDGNGDEVAALLADLPLANLSALRVLVETCYRVASQFNVTGMNALALATELAPSMLWRLAGDKPPAPQAGAGTQGSSTGGAPLLRSGSLSLGIQALRTRLTRRAEGEDGSAGAPPSSPPASTGADGEAGKPSRVSKDEGEDELGEGDFLVSQEGHVDGQGHSARVALAGADKEAVVRVVEYMILNADELLAAVC